MHVCMYVDVYACIYICIYVCMYVWTLWRDITYVGFMLENTAWTESDSRTIQFLVPSVSPLLDVLVNSSSSSSNN